MRSGRPSRPSASRRRSSASMRAELLARQALDLGLRRELGVALRQLEQAALGAALGGAHGHVRAAPRGQHRRHAVGLVQRRHDLRRDRRPVPVELQQELLEHVGGVAPFRVLHVERLPVHHRSVAHAEHLRVGPRLALMQADDVERLGVVDARRLALVHVTHGHEPVAQQRRLLELLRRRCRRHLALDVALHLAQPPAQEGDHLRHDLRVLLVACSGRRTGRGTA